MKRVTFKQGEGWGVAAKALSSWGFMFSILALLLYRSVQKRTKCLSNLSQFPLSLWRLKLYNHQHFFFSIYNFFEHMAEAIFFFFKDGFSFNCSCVCFTIMFNGNSPTVKPLFYVKQNQLLPQHLILICIALYHGNGNLPIFICTRHKFLEVKDCFNFIYITEPGI